MSAVDEQKGPNVRGFRALFAPRGQIRRDVRERTKIPPESAGDGRRGGTLYYFTTLKRTLQKLFDNLQKQCYTKYIRKEEQHNDIAWCNM